MENRTYINYVKYFVEGDARMHTDNQRWLELERTIPNYWEDTCPECGNKENITGCRCMLSHRTCPKCGFGWRWAVNGHKGILELIV